MALAPQDLAVIVNTGDDFDHLGLRICPDVDTVTYTLAGIANPETGWGIAGDTFEFLAASARLEAPSWFRIGDRDLATHVERTRRLAAGQSLTEATRAIAGALGARRQVLPMSDDPVRTLVETDEGSLEFQDYFVARGCEPRVSGFRFEGVDSARPSPEAAAALRAAELVVLCPSNPFVSMGPILALAGVKELIAARPAIAVSPIVGGEAIKGPAAKMLRELGLDVSAEAVARLYQGLVGGFVLDNLDSRQVPAVVALRMATLVTDTVMRSDSHRRRLAEAVLAFAARVTPAHTGAG
jgi:LPPG:FO 2-phospho-L-lactate transferase